MATGVTLETSSLSPTTSIVISPVAPALEVTVKPKLLLPKATILVSGTLNKLPLKDALYTPTSTRDASTEDAYDSLPASSTAFTHRLS